MNIATAIKTPQTTFRPAFSDAAKTGIDECISSDKTTFWRTNSTVDKKANIAKQQTAICFALIFLPSLESITPPKSTSKPLYLIGRKIEKSPLKISAPFLKKTTNNSTTKSGIKTVFAHFIFSIPKHTKIAPIIAIASPRRGIPKSEERTYSPPASIEQSDIAEDIKIPVFTKKFWGTALTLPATKKSPHNIEINTAASAVQYGEVSPKNRAISLPEENPAPIDVPIYKNATRKAANMVDCMQSLTIT